MKLWKTLVLAFAAMCCQDVFGTIMVVFEARLTWVVAGSFDVLGWIAGLICSALALEEIIKNGWRTRKSLSLIGVVSLANFSGTGFGVVLAARLTHP